MELSRNLLLIFHYSGFYNNCVILFKLIDTRNISRDIRLN